MARVQLPPGCYGLNLPDGTKYTAATPGGHVDVADRHAGAVNRSANGRLGLVSTTARTTLATRRGRRCLSDGFAAQAWTTTCPRCGGPTVEETP